jgi:hypothetical protein
MLGILHLKKLFQKNGVLKTSNYGIPFFRCVLALRHVYIFISTKKDGFLIPNMAHSEKKKFPAYIEPDQLIVQLQMQFSSLRNISGHYS